jgi:hypothetical protein
VWWLRRISGSNHFIRILRACTAGGEHRTHGFLSGRAAEPSRFAAVRIRRRNLQVEVRDCVDRDQARDRPTARSSEENHVYVLAR